MNKLFLYWYCKNTKVSMDFIGMEGLLLTNLVFQLLSLALLGTLCCFVIMFVVNALYATIAIGE